MTEPISLDVISDTICPWCYIGKRRLERALSSHPGTAVDVRWRPFQLDATIPKGGIDRTAYLENKFGGREPARRIYERVAAAGSEEGIPFDFDAIRVTPNTVDSHRLIRWAANVDAQDAVVERLFRLYFTEGGDIGDPDILVAVAAEAGMDADLVRGLLAGDDDVDLIEREIAIAQQMGVTGVPCFVLDNSFGLMGAQPPEAIAEALDRAVAERAAAPGTGTTG